MGYIVFLKDGPHHQQMKVERRFKKKKQQKKEKNPQHESFTIFGEWDSGGEESSASLSDNESSKKFTTRTNMCNEYGTIYAISSDFGDHEQVQEVLHMKENRSHHHLHRSLYLWP